MKPFFANDEARARLMHHAGQWIGTPFAAHQRVKGAGVDCVGLVASVYIECGFLKTFAPPAYSMDGGKHNGVSQLLAWFDTHPEFERVNSGNQFLEKFTAPGDVLCFKFRSQSEHHVGLKLLGPFFMHCLAGRRVEMATLQDHTYSRCLAAIFRPVLAPS